MTDNKKIFELYDLMEEKLQELEISFDEFTVLYGYINILERITD